MKEYKKLTETEKYDEGMVEELTEAMMEKRKLQSRMNYLQELIDEHGKLHQHIWGTADGQLIAHHKIEDDHLKNIMTHLVTGGRRIPKGIKAEARKRGFEVPDDSMVAHPLDWITRQMRELPEIIDADIID